VGVGTSSDGNERERPVDQARRLVPPGTWLDSPVFERAEKFVYDPNPRRTEDGWIPYAPIDGHERPAETSRQRPDAETNRDESSN
jgi:hypothetical protein